MKLNAQQIADVRDSLGASPVPQSHPAMGDLQEHFGDHTFYLVEQGLTVFFGPGETQVATDTPRLMMVAAWTNGERTELAGIEPVDTGYILPPAGGTVEE